MTLRPPQSTRTDTLFPHTTLFRSRARASTVLPIVDNRVAAKVAQIALGAHAHPLLVELCIDLIERGRADATLIASAQDQNAHAIGKRTERRCRLAHLQATDDLLQLPRTLAQPQRVLGHNLGRSDERRVGKEGVSTCRSRGSPDH